MPSFRHERGHRRTLRALAAGGLVLALVAMLSATVFILRHDTQSGLGLGAALAILPVPLYLAAVLWADRVEPEPPALLAAMFAWGAVTAFTIAYTLNTAGTLLIGEVQGARAAGVYLMTFSAPVVEELLKGAALFALLAFGRGQVDDLVDGLVYAAMIGLGFATTENILYYGRAASESGLPGALDLFIVRGVWNPFMHPLFTAPTGLGVAYAVTTRGRGRWVAPLLGLLGAMALHSIWNTGVRDDWFELVYYVLFVPLFVGLAIAIVAVRERESRVLADYLPADLGRGARVVAELGSPEGRRALRAVARRRAGPAGRETAAAYEHAAVQLAFLDRRLARGVVSGDSGEARRSELRRRFFEYEDELRRSGVLTAGRT
jgi:protease PrsW